MTAVSRRWHVRAKALSALLLSSCADGSLFPTAPEHHGKAAQIVFDERGGVSLSVVEDAFSGVVVSDGYGGEIGLDSTTGLLRVRNLSTNQTVFVDLPAAELSSVVNNMDAILLGDANVTAMQDINPWGNAPWGVNPMAGALAPQADNDDPIVLPQNRVSGFPVSQVLIRRSEDWASTAVSSSSLPTTFAAGHSLGPLSPLQGDGTWDPSCAGAMQLIGSHQLAFLDGRRKYVQNIVDAVPWADLIGGNVREGKTIDLRLEFTSPDHFALLKAAMTASENWWASIAFNLQRTLYNSWNCEGTIRVPLPGPRRIIVSLPRSGGASGGGETGGSDQRQHSRSCTTDVQIWSQSKDGGKTWTPVAVTVTTCMDN